MGDALCCFLSCLLLPHFLKRCPSLPPSIFLLEVVYSITRMTDKMSCCLVCDFSLRFLMSENRNVISSELGLLVHQDTAQSPLISYRTGEWLTELREGFGPRSLACEWILSFSLNCCSLFWRSHLSCLVFLSWSLLRVPWAYDHHKRFQWQA